AFDHESLSSHIARVEHYIPMVERVVEGKAKVEESLREQTEEAALLEEFQDACTCLSRYSITRALVAQEQFDAYTPADTNRVHRLIERIRSFDSESLSSHIARLEHYMPMVERVVEGKVKVEESLREQREVLQEHSRDK
ncbi:hypothetical protein KIPB_010401, partial [Kipferlia bialata]